MSRMLAALGTGRSSDISTGKIDSREPYERYREKQEEIYIGKSGKAISYSISPEEIEQRLKEQFGNKLQPKRDYTKKPDKPKLELVKKPVISQAKLEPKHLTTDRLKELAQEGKTRKDIMRMYNFTNENYVRDTIKKLGCNDLFGRVRKAK